jgi:hypothetical protein
VIPESHYLFILFSRINVSNEQKFRTLAGVFGNDSRKKSTFQVPPRKVNLFEECELLLAGADSENVNTRAFTACGTDFFDLSFLRQF